MCSRALVLGRSVDLCLCCPNKHFFNSARSETVRPNYAVHDFWTLLNYCCQMQMERHKNKEGNQIGRAYMRHTGGSMRLSVAEFSMENKVKCFQLQEGRSFSSFQGDLYYRDCFNFFLSLLTSQNAQVWFVDILTLF